MRTDAIVLSCEHGGNRVPAEHRALFEGAEALLATHAGYDIGALELAVGIAARLDAPLYASTTTRLLVDLNRSLWNPELLSDLTRGLEPATQERLLADHYRPYRDQVETAIRERIERGLRVIHVGVHTFTPILDGRRRTVDVGLLYDHDRQAERGLCEHWQRALRHRDPELRVLRNEPYRGSDDGLTTELRGIHPADRYLGLELEVSQRLAARSADLQHVAALAAETLMSLLDLPKPTRPGTRDTPARPRRFA